MGIAQSGGIGQTKLRRGAARHTKGENERQTQGLSLMKMTGPRLMSHWLGREVEKFLQALFFPSETQLTISLSEPCANPATKDPVVLDVYKYTFVSKHL